MILLNLQTCAAITVIQLWKFPIMARRKVVPTLSHSFTMRAPCNHKFSFCCCRFLDSEHFIQMEPYTTQPSMSGFFRFASCFQGPTPLQYVSELHSFIWLNNSALCIYHTLFIHSSWMAFGLFPSLGCYKSCFYSCGHSSLWVHVVSPFSWAGTQEGN